MDFELIERLIGLVERSRVTELELSISGIRVRIDRRVDEPQGVREKPGGAEAVVVPAMVAVQAPTVQTDDPKAEHHFAVAAGLFGTFFRAPGPGQDPFVSEGDMVEEGQTLAILEAMKMLNPVEADRAGRILRILVEDGTSVEAGTPLFTIAVTE